jgi:hypothetical protein
MAAAVLAVLLVLVVGHVPRASTPARVDAVRWKELPQGWSVLAGLPSWRNSAVHVWTGRELVLWGGDTQSDAVHHADGIAFDPALDRWRPVPEAPIAGRSQAGAAWTGRELIVWGGVGYAGHMYGDGAAYDPVLDRWRRLAPSPISPRIPFAVWTGRELIVWGDRSRTVKVVDGAAYDPEADRWRSLPPAPIALNMATAVWTGSEMIVIGSHLDSNNHAEIGGLRVIAYDPTRDSWRRLRPYPLSPQASTTAVAVGGDLLVWDYLLGAALYNPRLDRWRPLTGPPFEPAECYPESERVGELLLGWYCGSGALYDARANKWTRIPSRRGAWSGPIAADGVALFLGAGRLFAFKP